ncbi:hypothetical protein DFO67_1322 [Modicisalibacter xianhensis]|uniref:Uncharacterized protein n=1 Tax=Modicisalibacter xianhensis TaxID=442341 RepID=A0A4V3GS83_9GAMM|nr:hypothetical protein [Halomonas xianhensis]TDX21883.1 hypothetical protein DFO67_1322 [Halomonas xianhensis]
MATRQYENPWASGIKSLTGAYVAKQQGLAEMAAAQREAEMEAQRWAQEFDLDQKRTLSQLARDKSGIRLDSQEFDFNEQRNPLLLDQTRAQTEASRASAAASRANAQGQRLQNTAFQTNLDLTGGRSTDVYSPGQAEVANAEEITRLTGLARNIQQQAAQLPEGSPRRDQLEQTLGVLRNQVGRAQQVYDMTSSRSVGQVAATRADKALRALEDAGGDMSRLTPLQQRDVEAYYASQPQTDAGVTAMTESQRGKAVGDLQGLYNAALNLDDAMGQALGIIETSGDKIVGLPAAITNITDQVRGAVTGISDLTGLIDQQDAQYLDRITSGITQNASDAKTLQALLSDVAIMNYRLKNPNDPRMSDFDLRVQLRPLESGSARSIAGFINEARERIPQFYNNAVQSRTAAGVEVPEGLLRFNGSGRGQGDPAARATGGPQQGTVVDGYRFMGGDPNDASNWERAQ